MSQAPADLPPVLLVSGVHAARLGPGHGAAGGGGGAAGQGAARLHDRGRGGSATQLVLCSGPSVPQPVVQSRRRPLLGPSPG